MTTTQYTARLDEMRRFFRTGKTQPLSFRKEQLKTLIRLLEENADELSAAIRGDIHRSLAEAFCFEVNPVIQECKTFLAEMDAWAAPQKVEKTMAQLGDKDAFIQKDPLGLVLIISPWNYPINLMLTPLVGAIGAGNCAVIKPSEVAPHSGKLIEELIPKYFPKEYITVISGGVPETTDLLKERFDYIFYTGAPAIGKIVMAAASKHLTPVTLELGGQCPAIVDRGVDVKVAARRIAWGKFLNCGQTCVAPNHVFCYEEDKQTIVDTIRETVKEFYQEGTALQKDSDYARIINKRHFEFVRSRLTHIPFCRLESLVQNGGGERAVGGRTDGKDLFIEPTVLVNVKPSDPVMQDEIFGPILPILTVKNLDEALEQINEREKPLALYIFSGNQRNIDRTLEVTSSGGVCVNDCLMHMTLDTLPFGGVGNSGTGGYHGKFSFDTFSHDKSVLHRKTAGEGMMWMRYPPFNARKLWWMKQLGVKRKLPNLAFLSYLPILLIGILIGYYLTSTTSQS